MAIQWEVHMAKRIHSTLDVLEWAKEGSTEQEVVGIFWNKLCETLKLSEHSDAKEVLETLRLDGGNTLVNFFRDEGVAYSEVVFDVAKTLKPVFEEAAFRKNDVTSCEKYVLRRMEVNEDEIQALCDGVRKKGVDDAVKAELQKAGVKATAATVAVVATRQVTAQLAKQVTKTAARKVAQAAAKQATKEVAKTVVKSISGVLAVWTAVDIAGPAKRKTIPAVTYIALLRKLFYAAHENEA